MNFASGARRVSGQPLRAKDFFDATLPEPHKLSRACYQFFCYYGYSASSATWCCDQYSLYCIRYYFFTCSCKEGLLLQILEQPPIHFQLWLLILRILLQLPLYTTTTTDTDITDATIAILTMPINAKIIITLFQLLLLLFMILLLLCLNYVVNVNDGIITITTSTKQ